MKLSDYCKKGFVVGLLALLPIASQAGLKVEFDDVTLNGVGVDITVLDDVVGPNGDFASPAPGQISAFFLGVNGSTISVLASSGSPSVGILSDTQISANIAVGASLIIRVIDDMYTGPTSALFQTLTTPSQITNATISLTSKVNGVTVMNNVGLTPPGPQIATAFVNTGNPYTIEHIYTITGGSSKGTITTDTVTQAVPEPAPLALLGIALLGLALSRKRIRTAV